MTYETNQNFHCISVARDDVIKQLKAKGLGVDDRPSEEKVVTVVEQQRKRVQDAVREADPFIDFAD